MERLQYARIESDHGSAAAAAPRPPRTLRHKVSRALSTLTRREPGSPEWERGTVPPMPSPTTPSPTTEKQKERQNPLKRTWGRSVAIARTRSEPALRAKRAKAAAAALLPSAVPTRSAPVTTHSRDVNAYAPAARESQSAVVSYTYPLWRIDPVLVGCFVCL
ncbi:hypothetical protein LXA43DRAFT_898649 [Ganoderma leucocontextum]|nr:hypothetical protein LXA43DRAFT_898649 [Ganoderma leucocontextum]